MEEALCPHDPFMHFTSMPPSVVFIWVDGRSFPGLCIHFQSLSWIPQVSPTESAATSWNHFGGCLDLRNREGLVIARYFLVWFQGIDHLPSHLLEVLAQNANVKMSKHTNSNSLNVKKKIVSARIQQDGFYQVFSGNTKMFCFSIAVAVVSFQLCWSWSNN